MTPQERQTQLLDQALIEARKVAKGKVVRVVRGRKVPQGTQGVVGWIGDSRYGMRVGIDCGGERLFTDLHNVEVANVEDYMPSGEEVAKRSQNPIAGEDARTIEEAREALRYWEANHPQTLDYITEYVRAESEIKRAMTRIAALALADAEVVSTTHKQEAYGNRTITVVRGAYADLVGASASGSHAGLGWSQSVRDNGDGTITLDAYHSIGD